MDTIPLADHEAAVAAARAEATAAERDRIAGILQGEAAKGRHAAAVKLALTADVTPALAATMLETIPVEEDRQAARPALGPRSQDAPGGLVLADGGIHSGHTQLPQSDFERGQARARAVNAKI